jgi:transglycosylase-like protein with SLT domain
MFYWRTAAIVLLLTLIFVLPSLAGGRKAPRGPSPTPVVNPLDRIAFAVDGAESSHGVDQAMWRADATGPQGPMQVSEAAAIDVGGGDRFDLDQNRQIGRAYLAQLYRRYGDWPDAIAAYYWGIGNLNAWVKAGRPADRLVPGVTAYLGRVMHDSGLCQQSPAKAQQPSASPASACDDLGPWSGLVGNGRFPVDPRATRFQSQLDKALRLAMEHAH